MRPENAQPGFASKEMAPGMNANFEATWSGGSAGKELWRVVSKRSGRQKCESTMRRMQGKRQGRADRIHGLTAVAASRRVVCRWRAWSRRQCAESAVPV